MSDLRCTPADWFLDSDRAIVVYNDHRHAAIAQVYSWMGTREAQANAQVMVASKDLYTALDKTNTLLARAWGCLKANGLCFIALDEDMKAAHDRNDLALRKARGEA